jgi:hypothetical protein
VVFPLDAELLIEWFIQRHGSCGIS